MIDLGTNADASVPVFVSGYECLRSKDGRLNIPKKKEKN